MPLTLSHPLWSLKADLRMWRKMLYGTMEAEVVQILGSSEPEPSEPSIRPNMATDNTLH
jgi:hypothetical protein